ncbi:uncharacterized protein BDV17DRAFT_249505 [Aspergillus undulatus]|uniref:uncharacterized protein n=1 Tax=Aspergillus undulatus TaxID=1810928 RepID=UPI003CCCDC12
MPPIGPLDLAPACHPASHSGRPIAKTKGSLNARRMKLLLWLLCCLISRNNRLHVTSLVALEQNKLTSNKPSLDSLAENFHRRYGELACFTLC